jgi:hypothetical protein
MEHHEPQGPPSTPGDPEPLRGVAYGDRTIEVNPGGGPGPSGLHAKLEEVPERNRLFALRYIEYGQVKVHYYQTMGHLKAALKNLRPRPNNYTIWESEPVLWQRHNT